MIGIINYGMGNLASLKNALDFLKIESKIISSAQEISEVSKLILPGVGAFGLAMQNINRLGLKDLIRDQVLIKNKPILGICLGMQLFLTKSFEFGEHEGLNLIQGEVKGFSDKINGLPIPHVGWNSVDYNEGIKSWGNTGEESNYYFVHSYYCDIENKNEIGGITEYGIEFPSVIKKDHIIGTQFHPEKSQQLGLRIFNEFKNF